jgi:hypothetical protein
MKDIGCAKYHLVDHHRLTPYPSHMKCNTRSRACYYFYMTSACSCSCIAKTKRTICITDGSNRLFHARKSFLRGLIYKWLQLGRGGENPINFDPTNAFAIEISRAEIMRDSEKVALEYTRGKMGVRFCQTLVFESLDLTPPSGRITMTSRLVW